MATSDDGKQMIVSHKHKYMFLHCRKTAGISLKVALAKDVGPSDVVLGGWQDLRKEGIPFNRRFILDVANPLAVFDIVKSTLSEGAFPDPFRLNRIHKTRYARVLGSAPEHAKASDVRLAFSKEWGSYFKFCFVRNPYEMAVSSWLHRMRSVKEEYPLHTYLKLIKDGQPHRFLPRSVTNWPIYTIDDQISVNFVGRFENLERDVALVFDRLGLAPGPVPQFNQRKKPYDYRDFYGEGDKQLASQIFEKEIETFKYTF